MIMCLAGFGQNIPPQWGRIENFAEEKFLLGGGYPRSDFDHSDLLLS